MDTGHRQAIVESPDQTLVDLFGIAAESKLFLGVGVVIGIAAGHLAQGGVALHADEILESVREGPGGAACRRTGKGLAVDFEQGLVCVLQLPYEDHADEDRIAGLVIDLDGLGIQVPGAEAYALDAQERVNPVKSCPREGSAVFSEENKDLRLIGLQLDESLGAQDDGDQAECTEQGVGTVLLGLDEAENAQRHQAQDQEQGDKTVKDQTVVGYFFLVFHNSFSFMISF